MPTYTTSTLAQEILGDNSKPATRELRKFLRADAIAKGGRVGQDTPGKGGRYSIDLNKRELTAMAKRFKAWQAAEEKAKADRAALKVQIDEARAKADEAKIETPEEPAEVESDIEDNSLDKVEGPTDEEIAAMLSED